MFLQVVFAAGIIVDLVLAVMALCKRNSLGLSLGITGLGAAIVSTSYLLSVNVEDYFTYSVLSSLYFGWIDVTLFALLCFIHKFTQTDRTPRLKKARVVLMAYTIFDIVMLAVNPFKEMVIHYEYALGQIPHYTYEMFTLYQFHLILAYIYIIVISAYLVARMRKVPSVYRKPYSNAVWILVLVVLINAVYLYHQTLEGTTILDYSLLGYSLAVILFYWNSFVYTPVDMMNQLRNHIFASLDQGILLFDYENKLIMENEKAKGMFAETTWRENSSIHELVDLLEGKPEHVDLNNPDIGKDKLSFQCYPNIAQHIRPMRCDYSPLYSNRGEILGRLFVFSNLSMEYDVLTGFNDWDMYKRQVDFPDVHVNGLPETVAALDINGLTVLNKELGHAMGDRAIQTLAQRMREHFPEDTFFLRGREAILVAVCSGITEQQVEGILHEIDSALKDDLFGGKPLDFQGAVQTRLASESRQDAIKGAMDMLRTRKLLDQNSRHSAVLYSLVQALKECDSDTEAHVRRTQNLGARLGKRIGLNEEQQSNLALLAILHDIGKIGIPLDILNKPGKLTAAEWEVIKSHVEKGYQITSSTEELEGIADMVLYHHERWDGQGYPDGLSKESIPLLSRVISVVDSYDAMVNDRAYRKAMPREQAMQELKRCAGTQFDPTIVSEFLEMLKEEMDEEKARSGFGVTSGKSQIEAAKPDDPADVEGDLTGRNGRDVSGRDAADKTDGNVIAGHEQDGTVPETEMAGTDRCMSAEITEVTPPETAGEVVAGADGGLMSQEWSKEAPESLKEKIPRIHAMRFSTYVTNYQGQIIEIDDTFEQMTGYSREDVAALSLSQKDLIFEEDREEYFGQTYKDIETRASVWLEHRIRCKDGTPMFVYCYGRRYYDSAKRQEQVAIVITDSRESYSVQSVVRMEQNKALHRLERWENKYRRDSLTGLLNHEAFKNDVETRLLNGQKQALMLMIDVDFFKEYNDTYGHRAGDEFLIMVAQALLGTLRKEDFACRMGGDEFAAILFFSDDAPKERMRQRAQEICDQMNLMLTSSLRGGTSLSVGGAFLSETCNTFDRLYEAADKALYRSKENGRAKVSFE